MSDTDDLSIPDFLNRKLNGITPESPAGKRRADRNGIVWPRKKNWQKIEERRRRRDREEGIKPTTFVARRGQ